MDEYYQAVGALPAWLAQPLMQLPPPVAARVHELRLRVGCEIGFTVDGTQIPAFQLEMCPPGVRELRLDQSQMEQILYTLCGGAVHAHQTELAAGYITIPGGCRVGVGGQYLLHPQQGVILQSLRSMNLRIAREKNMPLPLALTQALKGHFVGFLLVGEPDSGKTTLLRHLARHLARSRGSVTVIDERRELFPQKGGAGEMLDVLSGLPKGLAVEMALRTLSPRVILLDELGGMEEVAALEQGFFSGVDFVASLHASSLEEAMRRPQVQALVEQGMLRGMAQLAGARNPGQLREVRLL